MAPSEYDGDCNGTRSSGSTTVFYRRGVNPRYVPGNNLMASRGYKEIWSSVRVWRTGSNAEG